ncbi:MAG: hypothetical protein KJ886_03070 [Candidatus Thermoplasmatota archaeon]|nr:hypothetical protein [Candidatus Thermoplasmatota archaeon]MBU4256452.1 hypothetical protein [Candidatus Thermoplasmatota archaeon]MCG2735689.1 hypothetical protein [Candidatus Methanoperedenaceae archaeon]MCG2825250.1 hypothetical protein [Thermoplasmatales archaeon]
MTDEKEDVVKTIGKVALFGVGVWLFMKFLESLGKNVNVYRCPNCGFILRENYPECPRCKAKLLWGNPTIEGQKPVLEKLSTKPWWVGFGILLISVVMLIICTLIHVANPAMIEIWKILTYTSFGYIVGIPLGAAAQVKYED